MSYLQEFGELARKRKLDELVSLWEEFCSNDRLDTQEAIDIMQCIKNSELALPFGSHVEDILPLCSSLDNTDEIYIVLREVLDLQTTNHPALADLATKVLQDKYGEDKFFKEKLRITGLRSKSNFQSAIRNYELLSHINKGKFVYHDGGWGTGIIMDYSLTREELHAEFENVLGNKELSFTNAFKTLRPLEKSSFLSQRFADPDAFELKAKTNPIEVIHLLLKDLGDLTAAEIKEEMCELVIPEADWSKWWQSTRSKLKKDTRIECPKTIRDSFHYREKELSHLEDLQAKLSQNLSLSSTVKAIYQHVRDFSDITRDNTAKKLLKNHIMDVMSKKGSDTEKVEANLLLMHYFDCNESRDFLKLLISNPAINLKKLIHSIDVIAFKKRFIELIQKNYPESTNLFLDLLFNLKKSPLRDYLLALLNQDETRDALIKKIQTLIIQPEKNPETFLWYFSKLFSKNLDELPISDADTTLEFFEAFLILFHKIEMNENHKEQAKKMYQILTAKKYQMIRDIFQLSSLVYAKEILLLVAKIQSLTSHDLKIIQALAEVAHPELKQGSSIQESAEDDYLWTTQAGYDTIKERLHEISTIETVQNAKEIEAARELGDLRENSEYKYALEKRAQLQAELKSLSEQFQRARVITPEDIQTESVGIGSIVHVKHNNGSTTTYTLLGPWDANPDENILSYQSKLAKQMVGLQKGEMFKFNQDEYVITNIGNIFD